MASIWYWFKVKCERSKIVISFKLQVASLKPFLKFVSAMSSSAADIWLRVKQPLAKLAAMAALP